MNGYKNRSSNIKNNNYSQTNNRCFILFQKLIDCSNVDMIWTVISLHFLSSLTRNKLKIYIYMKIHCSHTLAGMVAPLGGSGMCLCFWGLRYVTFLQNNKINNYKISSQKTKNHAGKNISKKWNLHGLVTLNVWQPLDRWRDDASETISLT